MKTTINEYTFVQDMTAEGYGFSVQGAIALFEYLEDLEEQCGNDLEYDPIAFRCSYTEYADLAEIKDVYCLTELDTLADLYEYTAVVVFDGGIIIGDF